MKKLLSMLIVSFCGTLFSQPFTINRSNYFEIGDNTIIHHKFDISLENFTPGETGVNCLWDFSSMDFEHPSVTTDSISYITPLGTPFFPSFLSADYSSSNLCSLRKSDPNSPQNNEYTYFISDNEKILKVGQWADNPFNETWEDQYQYPIKELEFPLGYTDGYSQGFSESFQRTYYDMSGGVNHTVNGVISLSLVGYGTLITPDNEILTDVIKVLKSESGTDITPPENSFNYQKVEYLWYSSSKKGFILDFEVNPNHPIEIITADYQKINLLNVPSTIKKNIRIFPTLTTGIVNIENQENDINSISIYSIDGRLVNKIISNFDQINLESYNNGVYLLKINFNDNSSITKKIIKKN